MTSRTHRFITGPLLPALAMTVMLVFSLAAFAVFRPPMDGRVFHYPDNAGLRIEAERRGIPERRDLSGQIEVFLEELFIGPIELAFSKTAPRGTHVRHVSVIGKTAFVDLGIRMLRTDEELPITFDEALENIRFNILWNFKRIEEVVFTIEGRQVHAPYYSGEDAED